MHSTLSNATEQFLKAYLIHYSLSAGCVSKFDLVIG